MLWGMHASTSSEPSRRLLAPGPVALLAIVGVAVYVAIDVLLAFARPDVSLIHDPESDYGRGAFSWLMDLNFLLRGALSLAAAAALSRVWPAGRSRWPLLAIGGWAVASALLAFFADDPAGGPATAHGRLHVLLALIAFLAATAGAVGAAWTLWRTTWPGRGRILLAIGIAAGIALLALARSLGRGAGPGGLEERLFLGLILLWLVLAADGVRRTPNRAT